MNELIIKGKQEFLGKQVSVIKGGFGENQKCVLVKDVASIHETEVKYINELIKNNLDEFEEGIDLLDLMSDDFKVVATDLGFISSNRQKYCYLLSEQGYMALVGLMKTPKAKETRKKFRREYFLMKDFIETEAKENNEIALKVNELIGVMGESLVDLNQYYRPTHKKKLDLNKLIHNILGTNYSRVKSDRVKEIVLVMLGNYRIWEEVPIDVLHSKETSKLIMNVCNMINNQSGVVQESMNI